MKVKLPTSLTNAHYGGINWTKKMLKSNYGKQEKERIEKYYKPLFDWIKYNYLKVAMRESVSENCNQWGESGRGTYTNDSGKFISQSQAKSEGKIER